MHKSLLPRLKWFLNYIHNSIIIIQLLFHNWNSAIEDERLFFLLASASLTWDCFATGEQSERINGNIINLIFPFKTKSFSFISVFESCMRMQTNWRKWVSRFWTFNYRTGTLWKLKGIETPVNAQRVIVQHWVTSQIIQ